MKVRTIVLLSTIALLYPTTMWGQTAREVLQSSYEQLMRHNSIQYNVKFRMKFFSEDDTNTYRVTCHLKKVPTDSLFGGTININIADTGRIVYDGTHIWNIKSKQHTARRYNATKGETWAITSNFNERSIWQFFLHPEKLLEYTRLPHKIAMSKNLLSSTERYKMTIALPDAADVTNRKICISFTDKFLPVTMQEWATMGSNTQYTELHILTPVFDRNQPWLFTVNKNISYTDYVEEDWSNFFLPDGATAPPIQGKNYPLLAAHAINYSNKVTLLDFWYMSCPPCIRSFPQIDTLLQTVDTSMVQIYSVNYHNNNEKDLPKLAGFIEQHHVRSAVVLTDKQTIDSFKVTIWPTFYVIDRKGIITGSVLGYNDHLADSLKVHLKKALHTQ